MHHCRSLHKASDKFVIFVVPWTFLTPVQHYLPFGVGSTQVGYLIREGILVQELSR